MELYSAILMIRYYLYFTTQFINDPLPVWLLLFTYLFVFLNESSCAQAAAFFRLTLHLNYLQMMQSPLFYCLNHQMMLMHLNWNTWRGEPSPHNIIVAQAKIEQNCSTLGRNKNQKSFIIPCKYISDNGCENRLDQLGGSIWS